MIFGRENERGTGGKRDGRLGAEIGRRLEPRRDRPGERGAATILIAGSVLLALTVASAVALSAARQELYRSIDYMDRTAALMLAEAALEDAAIHMDQIQNWGTIPLPHDEFVGYQPLGHGHYQARLLNNPDDVAPLDSDKAVRILAKGYSRNNEIAVTLEGMYRRIAFDLDPPAVLTVCGSDIYNGLQGNTLVSGFNHALPPHPCMGSGCNPVKLPGPIQKGGIFYEKLGRTTPLSQSSVIHGVPSEASGVPVLQGDKGFCAQSYGSPADPKLLYVPRGSTLDITGNTQGFGVLLIDGYVKQTGTFTFSGLIVIGRNAKIEFKGTANLFGAVVTAGGLPANPATMGTLLGDSRLVYSQDAIKALHGIAMPGLWYSWREYKGPEEPYPTLDIH